MIRTRHNLHYRATLPGVPLMRVPLLLLPLLLTACEGILGGIYDTGTEEQETGMGEHSVYIDATSYTQWITVDFHTLTLDTIPIATDGSFTDPEEWDIAIHRWDARTNGGSVLETDYTDLDELAAATAMPTGTYVEDIWTTEQIIIDMSQMMSGIFGYADSYYNAELSKWINVDLTSMPPTYTPSYKVYLVKLKDGTTVALRLSNYTNTLGVKGYLTIDYLYPFELP
ncbi:MAG: HmuY family protein [Prevotellaceae bacterium]|nr:HmuY family protein [Prevotellaceae bacterium]